MKTKCGAYVNQLLGRLDQMLKNEHHDTVVHLKKCVRHAFSNVKMLNKKCGPEVWAAMVKCNHDLPIEWAPFGRKEAEALHAEMEEMEKEAIPELLNDEMEESEEEESEVEEAVEGSSEESSEVEEVEEVEEEEVEEEVDEEEDEEEEDEE